MLKNLMEEKQLDFNQPLLSVRRFSAAVVFSEADKKRKNENALPKLPPLPVYKSELKSGPVRHAGTVPFVWEQIPGRPKDERKSPNQVLERLPTTPKLPPGRVSNINKQTLDKASGHTTAARSPTGNALSNSQKVSTWERKEVTKYESCKGGMEDKGSADSEDGDETYLDALSRSESFYMNCSVSGLSGLDNQVIIPSGTFTTDEQTRDFMMGRFLPAAKAMASETPQYATRKQPVAREQPTPEQPRGIKKVVGDDKQQPLNQYRSNDLPHSVEHVTGYKSEDKGMRVQGRLPISSVRRVRAKSYFASSDTEAKKEYTAVDACEHRLMNEHQEAMLPEYKVDLKCEYNQITKSSDCQKSDGSSVYRLQQVSGISPYRNECFYHEKKGFLGIPEKSKNSRETSSAGKYRNGHNNFRELLISENFAEGKKGLGSPVVEKTLYIDSIHTVKSTNSITHSLDTKGLIIDYRGNAFEIPEKSNEVEETRSVVSSFQDIEQLGDGTEKETARPNSLEYPDSSFLSCSGRFRKDVLTDMKNGSILDENLIQAFSKLASLKVADQEKFSLGNHQFEISGGQENLDGLTSDCSTLTSRKLADEKKIDSETQHSGKSHGHLQSSITLGSSKVANKGKIDLESHRLVMFGSQENAEGYKAPLPLGPPLPKSPSESWLKRTLPAVSSRSSSSQSNLGSRTYTSNHASKTSSFDPKWETIVKISNTHHGHLRFSEELLTPIPEV